MAVREKPWQYPESDSIRDSGLSRREQIDLADTPRPAKSEKQREEERNARLLKADKSPITADDRRVPPIKMHDRREVAEDGTPEMMEAMIRYINGEKPRTREEREWAVVLEELQRTNRPLWTILEERYFFNRTEKDIAAHLFLSQQTVSRLLLSALQGLRQRVQELFHAD